MLAFITKKKLNYHMGLYQIQVGIIKSHTCPYENRFSESCPKAYIPLGAKQFNKQVLSFFASD